MKYKIKTIGKKKEKSQKQLISEKMSFYEIISKYPKAAEILMGKGLSCVGCPMAMQESLEIGAKAHGINVKKLVEELNKKLTNRKLVNKN